MKVQGDVQVIILETPALAAAEVSRVIDETSRGVLQHKERFVAAFSGGRTPGLMLEELARLSLPWSSIYITQVDERIAPRGDPDRNLTQLDTLLLRRASIPESNVLPLPVDDPDLDEACRQFERELSSLAGPKLTLDLIHLGMGSDGHTASLVPGDPVLDVNDSAAAVTQEYQGRRRMTLTYPTIDRADLVVWLITGADKAEMLPRLLARDASIPAGRVNSGRMMVIADRSAARLL